jgi:hypothetical protein
MITKTVEKVENYAVIFTEDEAFELGIEEGQRFTIEATGDGLLLKPFVELELDIENWSKDDLLFLLQRSCEVNKSVNEVISDILAEIVDQYETCSPK